MISNYFKIAWRSLLKNKVFSFINVLGLTVGLTSFLLIALYIFDELTFDRFHKQATSIYRIVSQKKTSEGGITKAAGAGYQVTGRAQTDFPEVRNAVRLAVLGRTNVSTTANSNVFYEDFSIANAGFLTTFDFDLVAGDRNTALTAPHSVVVTEETAHKFFNTLDVIGKPLIVDNDSTPFKITGVLKNLPVNSHLSFHLLFSESSLTGEGYLKFREVDWISGAYASYLLLQKGTNAGLVEQKLNKLIGANSSDKDYSVALQPLRDIHFYSADIEGNSGKKGNISYIYVFTIIAAFVLLIACINYMNLTTARFAHRSKEIAVRKVAGASRENLVMQFLSEAFLLTLIASAIAFVLVKALLPSFNAFTEKSLSFGLHTDYRIYLGILGVVILAALCSGVYPALFQSRFKPISLFKAKVKVSRGNVSLRQSLVVLQFSLSIIMIVATLVVYRQMKYVSRKDMGFNKEQLVVIDINSGKVRKGAETIKNEFRSLANVAGVTVSSRVPGEWKDLPKLKVSNEKIQTPGGEDMYFMGIDDQFLKTYQVALVKGRNFQKGSGSDSSAVILNETAARQLGITEPTEQLIDIPLDNIFKARVIGIAKDFNFQSLHQPMAPMVLGYEKNPVQNIDYFTVRLHAAGSEATLKQMDAILHRIDQKHLFEYHFLDKQWDIFYREDAIRQTIFLIAALLTILIACLGLFGLATFAAEQRIKEIGIRKVLGASVSS
ncbi:MAG TPA: ABC transporter permease, partial [Chitinophagaceae bacterium]|nr:ABC transporter permease [Chitinophagaceae bacterium]